MQLRTIRAIPFVIGALCLGTPPNADAAPPPPGTPDRPGADVSEREENNTFGTRNALAGSDACRWVGRYFARLGPPDTGHPDTVLGYYNILGRPAESQEPIEWPEPVVALDSSPEAEAQALAWRAEQAAESDRGVLLRNDDAGPFRRWGGSQLLFLQEGPFGSRFRVTGKGCDPLDFSGTPCVHNQSGAYEAIINWFAPSNVFIGRTVFHASLANNDLDEFPINPPAGTFDFDIIIKTLSDYTGDVDFFEITGLRPDEQYIISTEGLHARFDRTLDTILGRFNAAGALQAIDDDIGLVGAAPFVWWNRNSRLAATANASGRIYLAVTGYNDTDFNGLEDPADELRHDEHGAYILEVRHRCDIGCADANGDCEVNFADVTHVLTFFGLTCQ